MRALLYESHLEWAGRYSAFSIRHFYCFGARKQSKMSKLLKVIVLGFTKSLVRHFYCLTFSFVISIVLEVKQSVSTILLFSTI